MSNSPGPPPTCSIAFKEWAAVCSALADGRQTILLRKGGIDEGPRGFQPEHPAFWLYPTHVHQAQQGVKDGAERPPAPPEGAIPLESLAVVEWVGRVEEENTLDRLGDAHIWTQETVAKRFHYRAPGLWLLVVRVFRRHAPVSIPIEPEHAGCKTWVPLGAALAADGARPVLDDATFQARLRAIQLALKD